MANRDVTTCSSAELMSRVQQRLRPIVETWGIASDEALLLLRVMNWDRRKLEERLCDDMDGLRSKVGVSTGPDPAPLPAGADADSTFECPVEWEQVTYRAADSCACGHWFSEVAWKGHLTSALELGAPVLSVECPADGCRELVRPRLLKRFLTPAQMGRYWELLCKSFAESSSTARWCPAPGCMCVGTSLPVFLALSPASSSGEAQRARPTLAPPTFPPALILQFHCLVRDWRGFRRRVRQRAPVLLPVQR